MDPFNLVDGCDPGLAPFFGSPFRGECADGNPSDIDADAERLIVDGSFKTPTLRNIALTPPYFHYGGYKSLEDVMDFYIRGGSHRDYRLTVDPSLKGDNSGSGPLGRGPVDPAGRADGEYGSNVDTNIRPLGFEPEHKAALIAFLKTLTDERVQCDRAPFDHPELHIPHGHVAADVNNDGRADDRIAVLPAVGAAGYTGDQAHLCIPNTGNLFAEGMQNRVGGAAPPSVTTPSTGKGNGKQAK